MLTDTFDEPTAPPVSGNDREFTPFDEFAMDGPSPDLDEPLLPIVPLTHDTGMMTMRPYQQEAVDAVFSEFQEHRSTLAVLATGLGKTIIFAEVAYRWPIGRVLIMAHREELIQQAADKVGHHLDEKPAIEMGSRKESRLGHGFLDKSKVLVTSVQTMSRPNRMQFFNPMDFGLIITDEAHHGTSDSYRRVYEYFHKNPQLRHLGVTATPKRADESALGDVFHSVAYEMDIREGIDEGFLVDVEQRLVVIEGLDFSQVRTTAGDLNQKDLASVMLGPLDAERLIAEESPVHKIVSATIQEAQGRPTIIFCVTKDHAEKTCEICQRHPGVTAEFVTDDTDAETRAEIIKRFREGRTQIFCNVGIATEGFDARVDVVAVARPTKSESLYRQMIGRGTRPLPGLVDQYDTAAERREAIHNSVKPCIAAGQRVLTDCGLVPIESVTTDMKVWDGIEFVSHCGSVFRGIKRVITYAGLTATLDHEVWTHDEANHSTTTETRASFGDCAAKQIPIRVTGIEGEEIWEAEGCHRRDCSGEVSPLLTRRVHPLQKQNSEGASQRHPRKGGLSLVREPSPRTGLATASNGVREAAMHKSKQRVLQRVRRSRNRVSFSVSSRCGNLDSGQSWPDAAVFDRSHRRERPLRAGQSSVGYSDTATLQSTSTKTAADDHDARIQDRSSRSEVLGSNTEDSVFSAVHDQPNYGAVENLRIEEAPVWDILNAGPRHRFTVEGLLVSNCMTVLDFVGASGRHSLVSAVDVLGGNYTEDVIEAAKRRLRESGETRDIDDLLAEEALAKAERLAKAQKLAQEQKERDAAAKIRADEERQRRQAEWNTRKGIRGHATYRTETVSAFERVTIPEQVGIGVHRGGASDGQVKYLMKLGIKEQAACAMTKGQAGAVIDKLSNQHGGDYVVTFGKHMGRKLREIPSGYLDWCMENMQPGPLRTEIQAFRSTPPETPPFVPF